MANKLITKKKIKIIVMVIIMIIILVLFLKILKLKNRIDALILDNESLNKYVSDINVNIDNNVNSLNFQIVNEANSAKENIAELSKDVSDININYASKSSINDIENMIKKITDSNINNDYSFEEDINIVKTKLNNQENKILDLYANKEDKINKVIDISESYNDEEYPSVKLIKEEEYNFFDAIYPIGSVYVSLNGISPEYGTWTKLNSGYVLWNGDNGGGNYLEPTLPNVSGYAAGVVYKNMSGPFYTTGGSNQTTYGSNCYVYQMYFDMHNANPIYQDGATVRPPAIAVTMFKRVA